MNVIDSIDLDSLDGFDLRAEIVEEDYYQPTPDGDDYSQEAIDAYVNGGWRYVGIVVTASRAGTDLGSDSIWAVEYGTMPGIGPVDPLRDENSSLDTYRADLIDNAVADARMHLTELVDQAIDRSME